MVLRHLNIAIDGPAGAGKSTLAKGVAKRLGIRYLDTGAMYRAMALYALQNGADPGDGEAMTRLLPAAEILVKFTEQGQRVLLGGDDVTDRLRTPEISSGASKVGLHPCVRNKLVELQRQVAAEYDVVMDGRDITTNVLPDTPFKFFVTASPEERARRRFAELSEKGGAGETYETVLADIRARDHRDSTRAYMPLTIAPDAKVLNTTDLSIEAALDAMLQCIREREAL